MVTAVNAGASLVQFTTINSIVPQLRSRDMAEVIQELSQLLQREQRVADGQAVYFAAMNREKICSSNMEVGMAFPHARLAELKALSFALGRSREPLRWGNAAGNVQLVFLMAVPENDAMQYLSLISGLARLSKDRPLLDKLHAAQDASQIFEVLGEIKLRTSSRPQSVKAEAAAKEKH
jgi:mannitol/fructose-specific phosphotransferase system IIA component (Ntr-type)